MADRVRLLKDEDIIDIIPGWHTRLGEPASLVLTTCRILEHRTRASVDEDRWTVFYDFSDFGPTEATLTERGGALYLSLGKPFDGIIRFNGHPLDTYVEKVTAIPV